jgi:glycosyltransferase involved in cell wall biosynthesis
MQQVTIILPIRNEERFIRQGLEAIQAQDYPADHLQILLPDGMSTDNTRDIIAKFCLLHPKLQLHVLDNPGNIVPTGLNIALGHARGEVIVRIDGHTIVAPDYVRQCVEILQRTHADNVGGRMNGRGSTRFGQAVALATSKPFGIGGGRFHYSDKEEWVDTVYMGAWPRRVFEKVGMFDEELERDQDDEFNYRLRAAGGKILLSPKIRSTYTVRSTPGALWRQYSQYGYWKVRVLQKHPRQMSLRQFVPPLFVFSLLMSVVAAFIVAWGVWLLALIAGSYLAANLLASVITAAKRGWRHLRLLPLVFAILHLSYGSGFLFGLVKFANRWRDRRGRVPDWNGGSTTA